MRTLLTAIALLIATPVLGTLVIVASILGFEGGQGTLFDWAPHFWARLLLRAGGIQVRLHNEHLMRSGEARIFVSNHVSWFDVLVLAANLPLYRFVAKAELRGIPIFGRGAELVGTIYIERDNRKAAFESYRLAAQGIKKGASVVVYPEGTRGTGYALRPFKKGPFVLAIAAGVPVVPTIIHGTVRALPRGSWWLRAGIVDVHFLDPVDTEGLTYEDRDQLARVVYDRMADALRDLYGVDSPRPVAMRGARAS